MRSFVASIVTFGLTLGLVPAAHAMDYTLTTCAKAETTLRTVEGDGDDCSKNQSLDEAGADALSTFSSMCDVSLTDAECNSVCAAGSMTWTGRVCVYETAETETSCQYGSKTCGVWPFRHQPWDSTVSITGYCGCTCRTAVASY
jgi:hypothetical protein